MRTTLVMAALAIALLLWEMLVTDRRKQATTTPTK